MKSIRAARSQRGAVLYVALIMLLLLSLLGIVAMQVATMQERMSAGYQASAEAFQAAEEITRNRELLIETEVEAGDATAMDLPPNDCTTPHDSAAWTSSEPFVRRLDRCMPGQTDQGQPVDESEATDQVYQVTGYGTDANGHSQSVIDTVFIP